MTYIPYANFLREVLPYCSSAPEIVAQNAIRNAAIEFCDKSHWLLYTPDAANGVANVSEYDIDTPNDTRLARLITAWWDNAQIMPKSEEQLRDLYGVDWRTITGSPNAYTRTDDTTQIVVVPYPVVSEPSALTMIIAIAPTRDSLTCDSDLYERWAEVIAHGALARLMSTPAQAYTNMSASVAHAVQFRAGISDAKIERNRGLDRAVLNARPPRFI